MEKLLFIVLLLVCAVQICTSKDAEASLDDRQMQMLVKTCKYSSIFTL